ncbi:MAG: hypothetical protein JW706_03825, partial [Opitutales bacterium]|nr:hypothetical protein [Opitutales bacterium]
MDHPTFILKTGSYPSHRSGQQQAIHYINPKSAPKVSKLFYIIGPRGSGKDAMARYVRPRLHPRARILFSHRYVTRPDHLGKENYVYLTDKEFEVRLESGLFLMNWSSNNLQYGIGKEVLEWMKLGFSVVVQGSRHYLKEADAILGRQLVPVLISVDPEILRERRLSKLEESQKAIEADLTLNRDLFLAHPNLIQLENNGPIDIAG